MYGRRVIYTDEQRITRKNVLTVLAEAFPVHEKNRAEIQRLWDIYRGKTAILHKKKETRENINHKICENRAFEVVNFYTGYVFGEPVQYIRRAAQGDDRGIAALNQAMDLAGKDACDNELAEWMCVCGVAYRLGLADQEPMGIHCLDPRHTFYIRYSGVGHPVVMAVTYVTRRDRTVILTCYTKEWVFLVDGWLWKLPANGLAKVSETKNYLGEIPIVEYRFNHARLGAFEPAVPLLDALNELQSNRLDDVEATVNAIMVLLGCGIQEEQYQQLQRDKLLSLPGGTDAKYLVCNLDQAGIQVLKEDLYQSILTVCGMPNRNGGTSTSDTGAAVLLRAGWQSAEARAKSMELLFKQSERQFLRLAIHILKTTVDTSMQLEAEDVLIKFTRRNYDNLQTKAQVLDLLLSNPKIHPETAYVSCGMFVDPVGEWKKGEQWYQTQSENKAEEENDIAEGAMSQLRETAGESVRAG